MKAIQYTLIKIPIKEIINQDYNVTMDRDTEIKNEYLITQGTSLLFDQIERLRGKFTSHINEVILVVAKKNPKQEEHLRHILSEGFTYNGIHYSRFGKSASQGKDGITAFVCDEIFDELYKITQMDIEVEECVISKYEAQRCLPFSSCTLIHDYMPNIVIIGEYEKTLDTIRQLPSTTSKTQRLEKLLTDKIKEVEQLKRYKREIYQDWKDGELDLDDYREMRIEYENRIAEGEKIIERLKKELESDSNERLHMEGRILSNFTKHQNITELTRELLVELVDKIIIYEGGKVEIVFQFADEFKKIKQIIETKYAKTGATLPNKEYVHLDATIDYIKEGGYYLIRYEKGYIRAWGAIKVKQ